MLCHQRLQIGHHYGPRLADRGIFQQSVRAGVLQLQVHLQRLQGQILTAKDVEALAELPTMDELRAELVGVLQAPMAELVGVLGGVARELVGILEAYAEKKAA